MKTKRSITYISIMILLGLFLGGCVGEDYQPVQPIFYSHKVHAGDNKIPCQYCHSGARRGDAAVIPSVARCMGCHKFINATTPDLKRYQPEIDKLRSYAAGNTTIAWVKVNDLQDFVRFSHKIHIKRGFACQECHGPVQTFTTGTKLAWDNKLGEAPLTMGWCVTCHERNAPLLAADQLKETGLSKSDPKWDQRLAVENTLVLGRLKDCLTCHK